MPEGLTSVTVRRKVLVVDDEPQWRAKLQNCLTQAGFDVLSAADGSEAMAQAADPTVGLMIVDEDLGGESGVMLSKFLRRNHPGVPTVLCTSVKSEPGKGMELRKQFADQWVAKDSLEELLAKVVDSYPA